MVMYEVATFVIFVGSVSINHFMAADRSSTWGLSATI